MGKKTVSVVMCTYNGEKYLREQMDSILAQTYPIHEIIVCDDCSTDGTMNILQEYATKFPFIKVHRNTRNKGCNQNFHDIFYQVSKKVDYIAISDQDDIWFQEKIGTEENCPSISHISLYLLMYMEHITSSNLETRKVLNVFTTIFMKKHLQHTIPSYTK